MKNETAAGMIQDFAAKLSSLAAEFEARAKDIVPVPAADAETSTNRDLDALATMLIVQRKVRRRFLAAELFHEPAWDMLLALYVARNEGRPMNVKTLVATADAPVTTSQRWVEHLHKLKLIDRIIDIVDRRRIEVSLSDAGERAITGYLREIASR